MTNIEIVFVLCLVKFVGLTPGKSEIVSLTSQIKHIQIVNSATSWNNYEINHQHYLQQFENENCLKVFNLNQLNVNS